MERTQPMEPSHRLERTVRIEEPAPYRTAGRASSIGGRSSAGALALAPQAYQYASSNSMQLGRPLNHDLNRMMDAMAGPKNRCIGCCMRVGKTCGRVGGGHA